MSELRFFHRPSGSNSEHVLSCFLSDSVKKKCRHKRPAAKMLFLVTCYNSDLLLHSISQIVGTIGQHGSISPISSKCCTMPQPFDEQ